MTESTGPLLLDEIDDAQHATNVAFFEGLADIAENMLGETLVDCAKQRMANTAADAVREHDPFELYVIGSMLMHAGRAGAEPSIEVPGADPGIEVGGTTHGRPGN